MAWVSNHSANNGLLVSHLKIIPFHHLDNIVTPCMSCIANLFSWNDNKDENNRTIYCFMICLQNPLKFFPQK